MNIYLYYMYIQTAQKATIVYNFECENCVRFLFLVVAAGFFFLALLAQTVFFYTLTPFLLTFLRLLIIYQYRRRVNIYVFFYSVRFAAINKTDCEACDNFIVKMHSEHFPKKPFDQRQSMNSSKRKHFLQSNQLFMTSCLFFYWR